MNGRCLLLSRRNPDTTLAGITAPILTMLLFAYVIGSAMQTGETSYVNFIVPGIILQCLGQCTTITAITVCSDIKSGIMERFYTMPVKRSSILNGHIQEAFIKNMVTALLILLVAFLIGSRPEADLLGWRATLLIIPPYILTLSWTSVYLGMTVNSPEGIGPFSILAIALPCISSGFVSVDTMPKALQILAEYQLIAPVIDPLRVLLPDESLKICALFPATLWCTVLFLLFYILSARAFKEKSNH